MAKPGYAGPLEQIDACTWRIPKSYKLGMRVEGRIFADDKLIEQIRHDQAPEQVANVATLPGIHGSGFSPVRVPLPRPAPRRPGWVAGDVQLKLGGSDPYGGRAAQPDGVSDDTDGDRTGWALPDCDIRPQPVVGQDQVPARRGDQRARGRRPPRLRHLRRPGHLRVPQDHRRAGLGHSGRLVIAQRPGRGPTAGRHGDRVADSEHKELRPPSAGRSEIRILLAFDPWRSVILPVAADKSGQWSR